MKIVFILSDGVGPGGEWANALGEALAEEGRVQRVRRVTEGAAEFLLRWPFLAGPGQPRKAYPNLVVHTEGEPFLFLGNRRMAYDEEVVRSLGITHIVDFHNEDVEPEERHRTLVSYHNCRVTDNDRGDLTPFLPGAFAFIEAARADAPTSRVLVHCNQGISRSASCVAYYIARREQMPFESALRLVASAREIVCPSLVFRKQVCALLGEGGDGGLSKGTHRATKKCSIQ